MIFDAHADILTDIYNNRKKGLKNVFKKRHLENFKKGKVKAGIFVIWIEPYVTDDAREELIQTLKHISSEIIENKSILEIVRNKGDLKIDKESKKIHMIMGIEGLKCIEDDIDLIDMLYLYGIRHVSLTWNEENKLGTGICGDIESGLSKHGRKLIEKLENLNMIIDVSHANEKTFWDILEATKNPIIASHSNSIAICNNKRNLTDSQIKAIGDRNGFIGVNIHKNFVNENSEYQNIEIFLDHIDHVVSLIGIDSIGFGFDFCEYLDDSENTNIKGIENISKVQDIIEALERRGYGKIDIEKISYKNFQRVIGKILK